MLAPPQNYAAFLEASRRGSLLQTTGDAAEGEADKDESDQDLYLFLQVIPQLPEECGEDAAFSKKASESAVNPSSLFLGAEAPLSSHVVCARIARSQIRLAEQLLKTLPQQQRRRVRLASKRERELNSRSSKTRRRRKLLLLRCAALRLVGLSDF